MRAHESETHTVSVTVTSAVYASLPACWFMCPYIPYFCPSLKIPLWSYAAGVFASRVRFTDYYVNVLHPANTLENMYLISAQYPSLDTHVICKIIFLLLNSHVYFRSLRLIISNKFSFGSLIVKKEWMMTGRMVVDMACLLALTTI